jgi:hypothetical protein
LKSKVSKKRVCNEKCPKCKSKLALAKVYGLPVFDIEPYENGKEEYVRKKDGRIVEELEVSLTLKLCPDCYYYVIIDQELDKL